VKAVGARIPRYDGIAHVTGRTQYVDDLRIHGSLVVKAFRSPVHRANVRNLDTSKAEAMKGVKAVVTWKDVPVLEYGHLSGLGIPADEPLLAKDEVRYLGQPIAVVAAEDEDTAMAAVEAIRPPAPSRYNCWLSSSVPEESNRFTMSYRRTTVVPGKAAGAGVPEHW